MLDHIKKLLWATTVPDNESRVKNSHTHIVEKPSFGDAASKLSKEERSEEHLVLLKGKGNSSGTTVTEGSSSIQNAASGKNKREYIKLDSDEEWDKFFELQNDPDTNTTNKEPFSPKKGESHYHGKEIVGKIADQIKAEISKVYTIESIMIKEGKREENIVYPTVRVVLHANKEGVDIAKLLGGSICKEYGVRTITFCHPNQEKKRGACCYINNDSDNEERVYEIISGLYEMTLKWYVDGKECKIKVNIDGKKGVTLLEHNGVTAEQLRANKEVKIGKRREPKSLYEALASQLQQKSSESITVSQQPSTCVTGVTTPTSTSQRSSF
ncbi:hypothetical protein BBB02_02840 [Wolbachia endosymbiont of Bemisia tabaci]|uniref:hypothetical protein n=1 Tax=Wolbachia endosymbiont of Bemisia tabaci TaxID=215173 RepID=UPI000FD17D7A|nr:hypothetical protein [Wolbachia endosymbiont of Bemisia tabaci]AZU37493.1 hypothetical protein BBB02_02840 [Wolbachia endosymbiont of Bemisia tabaci]